MRQHRRRNVGSAGQRVPVAVPDAVKRRIVGRAAQHRRLVRRQHDGLVGRQRQAVDGARLAQAVARRHDDQPVLVGVRRTAVGDLLGQDAHGGVRLANHGLVIGAEAAVGRGALGGAELGHDHVVALRDAVTRLRGDAVVNARAVGRPAMSN
ncbi:hypothetical protein G6F68_014305 [Rhizopus microsporus]|nr:hypothetical protein G6F68_014305 [Rhizopus microsporus]